MRGRSVRTGWSGLERHRSKDIVMFCFGGVGGGELGVKDMVNLLGLDTWEDVLRREQGWDQSG